MTGPLKFNSMWIRSSLQHRYVADFNPPRCTVRSVWDQYVPLYLGSCLSLFSSFVKEERQTNSIDTGSAESYCHDELYVVFIRIWFTHARKETSRVGLVAPSAAPNCFEWCQASYAVPSHKPLRGTVQKRGHVKIVPAELNWPYSIKINVSLSNSIACRSRTW